MDDVHVFTLPDGQDAEMVSLTTSLQIKIANNPRIQELARNSHSISFTASEAAAILKNPSLLLQGSDSSSGGAEPRFEHNPIKEFVTEAALLEMYSIVFAYVVKRVGQVQKPPATFYQELPKDSFSAVFSQYMKLNFPQLNEQEAAPARPLGQSGN